MDTQTSEIAEGIYRFSTFVPDIGPTGLTFNQYLIDDEQPLLFHTGHRATFPLLAEAIAAITPLGRLRWITFGHVEADECGAMNQLLAAAPHAEVAHGALGCTVSLNDLADRLPVPLADGQVIQLGTHRVRHIDTTHVPHGWEARVLYEETTRTLLCGDLFTQLGNGPAITAGDITWLEADGTRVLTALTRKSAGRAPLSNWAASSSACARVKFPVIWALPPGIGPPVSGAVTTFPSKTTAMVPSQ
jgi:flavorubredoxin